ncbi:hypothetical protein N7922_05795 [Kosakonia sp. ML.JS2a]|uniref:hypothetical protein n=1 Tax=Kosakonia sp. ML.JS2a TaxID=2980557 RepID=UPI0021DA8CB8|nr:hypothetical protein [Kosakonia sp. ML.JS2a]UXY12039.1 hypothetical protein N7922_05795 [Kosakonia sp. ML.JS2a]
MTNNDELTLSRKEFEAFYNETHSVLITPQYKRFGYYISPTMQKAWELWQQARQSLLAERDADKKRIAELETRTVSVKLPPVSFFDFKAGSGFADGAYVNLEAMNKELRKAGINLEVEE